MPAPKTKPKSRVQLLTEALEASRKAVDALKAVDLRTTRGDLREAVRQAREDSVVLEEQVEVALREDLNAARQHAHAS